VKNDKVDQIKIRRDIIMKQTGATNLDSRFFCLKVKKY